MAFTRESLNAAVSEKLADCNSAAIYHQGLFGITQITGIAGMVGSLLVAPLAVEVSIITGVAGFAFYGISQLVQTKRTGHLLPLPAVPVSAAQIFYIPARLISQFMQASPPPAPDEVRLLPADWLPQRERRINYLLTHAPDILIAAGENAQDGISFAAIVDTAVRASEMVITDDQIQNPVIGNKLRGDVRALLTGDTSKLEAQQSQAIAAEWNRAQADHAAGLLDAGELAAIEAEVSAIAPDVVKISPTLTTSADVVKNSPQITTPTKSAYESIIASPYRSRFFLGGQRTGKSYLAVASARAASEKGADIYYLNLSSWGTEDDGYSSVAIRAVMGNIQALTPEQAKETIKDARSLLQAFFISERPAILVLEEWCELGSRNHQHKALLEPLLTYSASIVEQLANTGQKRRKAVYATGPMFVAGSLQQATKAAKSMTLVLVAIAPGETVMWNEQALSFDPAVFSMAASNWHGVTAPPAGIGAKRIALVDGQWRAVGNIPAPPASMRKASQTIAATAPAIEVQSTTVEPAASASPWDKFRAQSADHEHLITFSNWLEKRDAPFTVRQITQATAVREAYKAAPFPSVREGIEAGLKLFTQHGFITSADGETFTTTR